MATDTPLTPDSIADLLRRAESLPLPLSVDCERHGDGCVDWKVLAQDADGYQTGECYADEGMARYLCAAANLAPHLAVALAVCQGAVATLRASAEEAASAHVADVAALRAEVARLRYALDHARRWMDRPGVDWWRHEHSMTLRIVDDALTPPKTEEPTSG